MLEENWNLYKEFYKVASTKSLSEAANKYNKSIGSFSKSIKELEDLLGFALFYRTPKGIELTKEGQNLYEYVKNVLITLETGKKVIASNNNINNSEIVIGCPSHTANFYLLDYIEAIKHDYPNIRVKVIAGKPGNELLHLLEEHKLDFIVDSTKLNIDNVNFKVIKLKELHNIFVANKEINIKCKEDFNNYKYILPFDNTSTKKRLLECLEKENISITSDIEIDITELRLEAIKRGLGIGYVIEDSMKKELNNNELYKVKVPFALPIVDLNLIYYKGVLTKASTIFIKNYMKIKI